MRKPLLIVFFIFFYLSFFAQNLNFVDCSFGQEEESLSTVPTQQTPDINIPELIERGSRLSNASVIQIGSSYNIFSILLSIQNQVMYNPDINTIVMGHRQNNGEPGGSGTLSYDYSTDGGATWNTMNKPITPTLDLSNGAGLNIGNGNRYPNTTIYNPAGNTDPNNAVLLAVGAALHEDPVFGQDWGWEVVASSPLIYDETKVSERYYTIPDSNAYYVGGLNIVPNGDVHYANFLWNTDVINYPQNYREIILSKLNYNAATSSFDRTTQNLMINQDMVEAVTLPWLRNINMAFSPDGMIGYVMAHGTADGQVNTSYGYNIQPIIFKTTDGGTTWSYVEDMDYSCFSNLSDNTIATNQGTGPAIPFIGTNDMIVDEKGDLHIFTIAESRFTTSLDSLGWTYVGQGSRTMYHLITDGTLWRSNYIYTPLTDVSAIGSRVVDHRPQISRNTNGDKIFMTWVDTDPVETGLNVNSAPDAWGMGYDINTFGYTTAKNLTAGTGGNFQAFYATISPICISNGNAFDYQIPLVYGVPTGGSGDPMNYWYLHEAGFDETEFGAWVGTDIATDASCEQISVDNDNLLLNTAEISVFPNPTQGLVNVDLSELDKSVDIDVVDVLGNQIMRLNKQTGLISLDFGEMSKGVYFIRVHTNNGVVTKKISFLK